MAGPSVVSGIAGGALNVPGSRPLPQQGGGRFLEFARMMAQVKGNKETKARQDAADIIQAIKMGLPVDPEDAKKKLEKGFNVKFMEGEQLNDYLNRLEGKGQQKQGAPAAPVPQSVTAQDVTKLGAIAQPMAGAQAATPPSRNAATKAPGGGVVKGATSPGTGTVEKLFTQAQDNPMEKFGALSPLYEGAISQQQMQQAQAQLLTEQTNAHRAALQGDEVMAGRFILLTKGQMDDSTMRAIRGFYGDSDEGRSKAFDFALGNELPVQKAERLSRVQVAMMGNENFMGRFKSPADAARFAKSIVETGVAPADISYKRSYAEMAQESATAQVLMEAGLDGKRAFAAAEMQTAGIPISEALPEGMKSLTMIRMETARLQAQAALASYAADIAKIEAARAEAKNKDFFNRFDSMVAAKRAGIDIGEGVETQLINELAQRSNMKVERSKSVWRHFWGAEFVRKPSLTDEERKRLQGRFAGDQLPGAPPQPGLGERVGAGLQMIGDTLGITSDEARARKARRERAAGHQ
ncbi:hypothetical protein LCGC14_0794440 [marine sediment metagenome]|uniref:Uncharacterized protein n=2 Tax=marine sediment metagenome TaxID=412755 RepID=A0A0F9SYR7_9ZZZZ